jgi:hypothetical protein
MANKVEIKHWGRVKKRTVRRMTIQQALTIVGLPKERVYPMDHNHDRNHPGGWVRSCVPPPHQRFWDRDEYELWDIVDDMRLIFHARLKEVGHDFVENHEEAQGLIGAYRQACRLFKLHGVPTERRDGHA